MKIGMTPYMYNQEDIIENYKSIKGFRWTEEYLVNKYFQRGATVLDVGCGAGRMAASLSQRGLKVTAFDLSLPMVQAGKREYPHGITWIQSNAAYCPFQKESFDHVLFSGDGIDLLYPYRVRVRCFKEMFRVVKPGGYVIYSSRNLFKAMTYRFKKKGFWRGLKATFSQIRTELKLGNWKFMHGYLSINGTYEGWVTVQASTMEQNKKTIKKIKEYSTQFKEMTGDYLGMTPKKLRWSSSHLYYVFQKCL